MLQCAVVAAVGPHASHEQLSAFARTLRAWDKIRVIFREPQSATPWTIHVWRGTVLPSGAVARPHDVVPVIAVAPATASGSVAVSGVAAPRHDAPRGRASSPMMKAVDSFEWGLAAEPCDPGSHNASFAPPGARQFTGSPLNGAAEGQNDSAMENTTTRGCVAGAVNHAECAAITTPTPATAHEVGAICWVVYEESMVAGVAFPFPPPPSTPVCVLDAERVGPASPLTQHAAASVSTAAAASAVSVPRVADVGSGSVSPPAAASMPSRILVGWSHNGAAASGAEAVSAAQSHGVSFAVPSAGGAGRARAQSSPSGPAAPSTTTHPTWRRLDSAGLENTTPTTKTTPSPAGREPPVAGFNRSLLATVTMPDDDAASTASGWATPGGDNFSRGGNFSPVGCGGGATATEGTQMVRMCRPEAVDFAAAASAGSTTTAFEAEPSMSAANSFSMVQSLSMSDRAASSVVFAGAAATDFGAALVGRRYPERQYVLWVCMSDEPSEERLRESGIILVTFRSPTLALTFFRENKAQVLALVTSSLRNEFETEGICGTDLCREVIATRQEERREARRKRLEERAEAAATNSGDSGTDRDGGSHATSPRQTSPSAPKEGITATSSHEGVMTDDDEDSEPTVPLAIMSTKTLPMVECVHLCDTFINPPAQTTNVGGGSMGLDGGQSGGVAATLALHEIVRRLAPPTVVWISRNAASRTTEMAERVGALGFRLQSFASTPRAFEFLASSPWNVVAVVTSSFVSTMHKGHLSGVELGRRVREMSFRGGVRPHLVLVSSFYDHVPSAAASPSTAFALNSSASSINGVGGGSSGTSVARGAGDSVTRVRSPLNPVATLGGDGAAESVSDGVVSDGSVGGNHHVHNHHHRHHHHHSSNSSLHNAGRNGGAPLTPVDAGGPFGVFDDIVDEDEASRRIERVMAILASLKARRRGEHPGSVVFGRACYVSLSNTFPSEFMVEVPGRGELPFPNVEQFFQAAKHVGAGDVFERIRTAPSIHSALRLSWSRRIKSRVWNARRDAVMFYALLLKFSIPRFAHALLATGTKDIIQVTSDEDSYWGDGGCGVGHNRLGEMLCQVRALLQEQRHRLGPDAPVAPLAVGRKCPLMPIDAAEPAPGRGGELTSGRASNAAAQASVFLITDEVVGRGGFGIVYKAIDTFTNQTVVAKVAKLDFRARTDRERAVAMLRHEFEILERVDDPNVVKVLCAEFDDNTARIYMEYMSGGSVENIVDRFRSYELAIRCIVEHVLRGLECLHSRDIIHCDIKPGNILMGDVPKLSDFGTSVLIGSLETKPGGTALYTSPQRMETGNGSKEDDIWAIGCTIVRMALGRGAHPWLAPEEDVTEINHFMICVRMQQPPFHPTVPAHLSPLAQDFVMQCFTRDPSQRPTASELLRHRWFFADPIPGIESLADYKAGYEAVVGAGAGALGGRQTSCFGCGDTFDGGVTRSTLGVPGIAVGLATGRERGAGNGGAAKAFTTASSYAVSVQTGTSGSTVQSPSASTSV